MCAQEIRFLTHAVRPPAPSTRWTGTPDRLARSAESNHHRRPSVSAVLAELDAPPVTSLPHTLPGSAWSAPRKDREHAPGKLGNGSRSGTRACRHTVAFPTHPRAEKETVMNPIRYIRRIAAVLVGLAAAVLAATPAFATAGARSRRRIRGAGLVPAQIQYRTLVAGGMPGWQIALIAVGAALLAATVAVLADRARACRQPAGPHGCLSHARSSRGAVGRRFWRDGTAAGLVVVPADRGRPVRNARGRPGKRAAHRARRRTARLPGPGLAGRSSTTGDCGTCRVQVHLARGPLRPPLRMRLQADHWSSSPPRTALELIPCGHVRPSAAYFRAGPPAAGPAGHLAGLAPAGPAPWTGAAASQPHADQGQPGPARSAARPARTGHGAP